MFIDSGAATLFATGFGVGGVPLIAHGGWVGSGELWLPPFEVLSARRRTITYDHRGTGATQTQSITFDELVGDLFAVLDAMGVKQCVVAAESAGAPVVIEACARQPSRFLAMVLVAPRTEPRPEQDAQLIGGCNQNFDATMNAFVDACLPDGDAAHKAWGRQIVKRSNAANAIALMRQMANVDVLAKGGSIAMPTLILHGGRDAIVPVASSEKLAGLIPGAKLVVHESAGHVPTVTEPQWVASQIEDFLAKL